MKKRQWLLSMALMAALILPVQAVQAEENVPVQSVQEDASVQVQVAPEHLAEYEQAASAFLAQMPGAVIDYAVRERDDGRYEWDLFFTLDGQLGECEIAGGVFNDRRVSLYDMPENALNASQAMALLAQEKGNVQIVDLELDREKGQLCYEGEALLENKRYEFSVSVLGEILEWKRD